MVKHYCSKKWYKTVTSPHHYFFSMYEKGKYVYTAVCCLQVDSGPKAESPLNMEVTIVNNDHSGALQSQREQAICDWRFAEAQQHQNGEKRERKGHWTCRGSQKMVQKVENCGRKSREPKSCEKSWAEVRAQRSEWEDQLETIQGLQEA